MSLCVRSQRLERRRQNLLIKGKNGRKLPVETPSEFLVHPLPASPTCARVSTMNPSCLRFHPSLSPCILANGARRRLKEVTEKSRRHRIFGAIYRSTPPVRRTASVTHPSTLKHRSLLSPLPIFSATVAAATAAAH